MNNVAYHFKRILIKIARLALYGFITYKIYINWETLVENYCYKWGCQILMFLMGVAAIECVVNIFYHMVTVHKEPSGDLFRFCLLFVVLFLISGNGGYQRTSLNMEEKMILRETFREYDRYKAGDNVHNYYKKNGRL